jgi:hypothetical protein
VSRSFTVPDTGFPGPTVARFRVSTDAALSSAGAAIDGDVENDAIVIPPDADRRRMTACHGLARASSAVTCTLN